MSMICNMQGQKFKRKLVSFPEDMFDFLLNVKKNYKLNGNHKLYKNSFFSRLPELEFLAPALGWDRNSIVPSTSFL